MCFYVLFFFFQAEDGIRDLTVTGAQTCALPIWFPWCYGADDLYLQAGEPLPPAEWYGDFEQRENGVGAVRYLQTQIAAARNRLPDLGGKRIGVVTGAAMGPLMPQVLAEVAAVTGAQFELVVVENALFGASVTTAGLLPAAAVEGALPG